MTIYHRTPKGWTRDVFTAADAVIELPELEFSLPLATIYARVEV